MLLLAEHGAHPGLGVALGAPLLPETLRRVCVPRGLVHWVSPSPTVYTARASASGFTQADWSIVERGWHAHVLGEAPHTFTSALEAVKTLRVRHMRDSSSMGEGPGWLRDRAVVCRHGSMCANLCPNDACALCGRGLCLCRLPGKPRTV